MKSIVAAVTAIVLAIAATTASAGVVITQDVTESNQPAGHKTEQTIMIQGHMQKLVEGDRVYITDLDAGRLYFILPAKKAYMNVPFPPITGPQRMIARHELPIGLKKTPRTDKVAGYACQDYTTVTLAAQGTVRVTQCVASEAPGAKEFVEYQKTMAAKLKHTVMALGEDVPDGIPVLTIAARFVNRFTGSINMAPEIVAKMKAETDKIKPYVVTAKVTKIEQKDLPADTFVVPKDYAETKAPKLGLPGKITQGTAPGNASAPIPAPPAAPATH